MTAKRQTTITRARSTRSEAHKIRLLYKGLQRRETPETVAAEIVDLLDLPFAEASRFPRSRYAHSSMSTDFVGVKKDLTRPANLLVDLLHDSGILGFSHVDGKDATAVADLARRARAGLLIVDPSFRTGRLDRSARRDSGLGALSRRRYDKLFRLTTRLSEGATDLDDQIELAHLTQFAKVGMAMEVPWQAFRASPTTAAFVAYMAANLARRSLFTAGRQAKAFDGAAEVLLERLTTDPLASWFAAAHVFPRADILARVPLGQRVALLERSRQIMAECAERLHAIYEASGTNDRGQPSLDLKRMIVHKGNDSSTWNALAGAWNKARDLWLATAYSVDPSIVDALLPGKVLRLMAADVVFALHKGELDENTAVWGELPLPWQVMRGEVTCTRRQTVEACQKHGMDPNRSGWAAPRDRTAVADVVSTPESVHGVVVSHPQLAELLRKAGWFSGKPGKVREVAPGIAALGDEERAAHHAAYGVPVAAGLGAPTLDDLDGLDDEYPF